MMSTFTNRIFYKIVLATFFVVGPHSLLIANQFQIPAFGANYLKNKNNIKIIVNNRPLVKIHDKIITVLDIKKKMDLFLQENHPEALSSDILRYQYYVQNWRSVLEDAINTELMKMEAEEIEYKIPDTEITQELEKRFGPNVYDKIDQYGLTFDEARSIVYDDLISKILSWYRVWARTNQLVSPDVVRKAYEDHIASLQLSDECGYQILTVRGGSIQDTESVSKNAYNYLSTHPNSTFADVIQSIKSTIPEGVTINVSETYESKINDLSREYASILKRLPIKAFSEPVKLVSRIDGSTSFRIFQLMDLIKSEPPEFEALSEGLKSRLFEEIGSKQREEYLAKLRKRFYCEDLVVSKLFPPSYQPFEVI